MKTEFGGENYYCSKLERICSKNGWSFYNNINFKPNFKSDMDRIGILARGESCKSLSIFPMVIESPNRLLN